MSSTIKSFTHYYHEKLLIIENGTPLKKINFYDIFGTLYNYSNSGFDLYKNLTKIEII